MMSVSASFYLTSLSICTKDESVFIRNFEELVRLQSKKERVNVEVCTNTH